MKDYNKEFARRFGLSRARLSAKTEFILTEQLSDVSSEPKFTIGLNERIN